MPSAADPRPVNAPGPVAGCDRPASRAAAGAWCDTTVIVAIALTVATVCFDHFAKPHNDFFEFRETGTALWSGRLPDSLKRAPLFPLLVVGLGAVVRCFPGSTTPPDQLAAALLNAALLPAAAVLLYLLGRRWLGRGALWPAIWFALLPYALWSTAHVLVEPLLVALMLAAILASRTPGRLPYALAALASVTRYDAAGLIAGVALADALHGVSLQRVALRAALACLPLALWLGLTAATWRDRARDHYLSQMFERPTFELVRPVSQAANRLLETADLSLPSVFSDWRPALAAGLPLALGAAALPGAACLMLRRDRPGFVLLAALLAYLLVHAAFPFDLERFGYPGAVLLLPLVSVGLQCALQSAAGRVERPAVRIACSAAAIGLALLTAFEPAQRIAATLRIRPDWLWQLAFVPPLVLLLSAAALVHRSRYCDPRAARWPSGLAALTGVTALAVIHVHAALPLLGSGREMLNLVHAARWVTAHADADSGVLSGVPGLLRIHARDDRPARFVGLEQIAAGDWDAVLAECRRRRIRFIVWYAGFFDEQGAYYIDKWRLQRFATLDRPAAAPGLTIEAHWPNEPETWILRVND